MIVDEATRTYVQSVVDSVPNQTGNLDAVVRRGARRRRITRVSAALGGVAAVVLVLSPMLLLASTPDPLHVAAGDGSIYLSLAEGFDVSVEAEPVESHGALVYVGSLGPQPVFDTSQLGTEVRIEQRGASHLVVPPSSNPLERNALRTSVLVYIGDVATAQLALNVFDDTGEVCMFFGNGTEVTGGGYCPVTNKPEAGMSTDPVLDGRLVWSRLPEDTAVVQIVLPDGSMFWQRPVARTAFFHVADPGTLAAAQLVALDADGRVLIGDEAAFLDDHENWQDPLNPIDVEHPLTLSDGTEVVISMPVAEGSDFDVIWQARLTGGSSDDPYANALVHIWLDRSADAVMAEIEEVERLSGSRPVPNRHIVDHDGHAYDFQLGDYSDPTLLQESLDRWLSVIVVNERSDSVLPIVTVGGGYEVDYGPVYGISGTYVNGEPVAISITEGCEVDADAPVEYANDTRASIEWCALDGTVEILVAGSPEYVERIETLDVLRLVPGA